MSMEPVQTESERFQTIQLAAYYLWQDRGRPFGAPEVDWFRAEEQVRSATEQNSEKPAIVAVAEAMGSALGAVAGLVASAGSLVRSDETAGTDKD
ncbi:MAG: hypothetical protein JWP08_897 [Bryobacterales bacterium]|jgi:DUF2934 family protein|nr:hypothetical protein [Bryobacterales bacterium]